MKSAGHKLKFHRWELRSCARHGHATYRPTGKAGERLAQDLRATSSQGEAWRCLRCGNYILGSPRSSGSVEKAPRILRGKVLRQATILRLLAIERIIRGLILLVVAYGIYKFRAEQGVLQMVLNKDLPVLEAAGANLNWDVDSSALVKGVQRILLLKHSTLTLAVLAVTAYGLLEGAEGVGLWLMKRWGEYLTAAATALFIPLEISELLKHPTLFKGAALAVNIAAVIYLVVIKRLFGARGGKNAYEAELDADSLLHVQETAAK